MKCACQHLQPRPDGTDAAGRTTYTAPMCCHPVFKGGTHPSDEGHPVVAWLAGGGVGACPGREEPLGTVVERQSGLFG